MNREYEFAKNSVILSIGTVIPKFTQIITLPIITGCLSTSEYGTYDLITVLVSLILPVATLQIQTAAFRFLVQVRENLIEQKKIITNILIFTFSVSILVLCVLYACTISMSPDVRWGIIFYFLTDMLISTTKQITRGLGKNMMYSICVMVNSISEMIMVVIFLAGLRKGLFGVILAMVLSQVVSLVFLIQKSNLLSYVSFKLVSFTKIREMLSYSWPMIPNSLSSWIMRLSDRLVLTAILGTEANAIYAVANKLPNIYSTFQSTISLAWQENASISVKDVDSDEYYGNIFDNVFEILVGIMALLIAFTPLIFRILIHGDYDASYNHMPILYLAALFSSISSFLGGIYIAHMKTKEIGITTTLAAAANFLIDISLVNTIGIYAASISTLVSYLVLTIYRMIDVQKFQKVKFRWKKIVSFVLVLVIMAFLCFQRNTVLDIINMFLSIIIAVALNRNKIIGCLRMLNKKSKHHREKR